MGEEKKTSTVGGWIKAGVASIVSLIGGGVLMYISPFVNSAIKPAKPVANFAQQAQGLTVTFQNRSTGGTAGWWDFGDGSALEPFVPNQDAIVHTYPKPGNYTVKLNLHNFIGEENERAAAVNLESSAANGPVIESFQVIPLRPNQDAPAVFRVVSQVKNADMLIWSLGDDRPIEINTDPGASQDRLITLNNVGTHVIRLVAVSGKQTAEKTKEEYVGMPDPNAPVAELRLAYEATKQHAKKQNVNVARAFPANAAENTFSFTEERAAPAGFQIIKADFVKTPKESANLKDVRLTFTPDKVVVTGTLIKTGGLFHKNAPPPNFAAEVILTLESMAKSMPKTVDPVALNLQVPGSTILPIPALNKDWKVTGRALQLELRAGDKVFWRDSRLPVNALVQINGRAYRVTAIEMTDQVRVDVVSSQTVSRPGNK